MDGVEDLLHKFRSVPNSCVGCPLSGVDLELKIANRCNRDAPWFKVTYTLNDLGKQVCVVEDLRLIF